MGCVVVEAFRLSLQFRCCVRGWWSGGVECWEGGQKRNAGRECREGEGKKCRVEETNLTFQMVLCS